MKIIFLDIDGVINGYGLYDHLIIKISDFFHARFIGRKLIDPFGVHYSKVRRLAKIVHATGAEVVMSSTWRGAFFDDSCKTDDIVKLRRLLKKFDINVIDRTGNDKNGIRGQEILDWLDNAKRLYPIESFVILDDETFDIIDYFPDRIVKTAHKPHDYMIRGHWDEKTGLKHKHIKQAIKILNMPL